MTTAAPVETLPAARTSKWRIPVLVIRLTWCSGDASRVDTARSSAGWSMSPAATESSSMRQSLAVSTSDSARRSLSTTATTSSPGGSAASSASRTRAGSQAWVRPISRNSASVAAEVGEALA